MTKIQQGILVLVLLATGCRAYPPTTPTAIPITPTQTATPVPSPLPETILVTPQPTEIPDIRLSSLRSGQYIIYSAPDGLDQQGYNKYSLFAISMNGTMQGRLTRDLPYGAGFPSPDKRSLYFEASKWFVRDIESGIDTSLDFLDGCNRVNVSSDNKNILTSCIRDNKSGLYDIYLVSLENKTRVPITDCETEGKLHGLFSFNCGAAAWSPDGKWIASHRGKASSGPTHPADGTYLTDASCVPDIKDCFAKTIGPIRILQAVWSPDSHYLAGISLDPDYNVLIFDNKSKTSKLLIDAGMFFSTISWSPDGKWIAFSQENSGIFLVSLDKPQIIPLVREKVGHMLFWINVP